MTHRSLLLLLALGMSACSQAPSCGSPPCTVARAHLGDSDGYLIIPATLNGHPIEAVLDTGAWLSSMTVATADAVGATTVATTDNYSTGIYNTEAPMLITGVGGATVARLRTVDELQLAGGRLQDMGLWAVPSLRFRNKRIAGLIGGDLLQNWDLDLDWGNEELALDTPQRIGSIVPPWKGATTEIHWSGDWRIKIPVVLDGHHLVAQLDTGAPLSYVASATEAGAEVLASDRPYAEHGVDANMVHGRVHHFFDLSIGGHSYGPIDAQVGPLRISDTDVDMLLGADFLNAYRVYIAYHARELLIDDDTP